MILKDHQGSFLEPELLKLLVWNPLAALVQPVVEWLKAWVHWGALLALFHQQQEVLKLVEEDLKAVPADDDFVAS